MSLLLIIWTLSLVVLSAILGFASAYAKKRAPLMQNETALPGSFGEFIADQCHEVLYRIERGAHRAKPHVRNLSIVLVKYSERGHDFFVERVFGRMEAKKGVSTSFFLKSIAEHKVGTRADGLGGKA